jgi:hypothetical protein
MCGTAADLDERVADLHASYVYSLLLARKLLTADADEATASNADIVQ